MSSGDPPGTVGRQLAPIRVTGEPAHRSALQDVRRRLDERFWQGEDIEDLVRCWTSAVDQALESLFAAHVEGDAALLAVGGYGRQELLPASDIDLLVLLGDEQIPRGVERFVAACWDLGLEVGHAVRTRDECREAARDLTVMTNLMEARHLAGDRALAESLADALGDSGLWPFEAFYAAKCEEQERRYTRFNHVDYDLEPNVKYSPGGLRDIHTLQWIARRYFGNDDWQALQTLGFLTDWEHQVLREGRRFLWRVRWGLQSLPGNARDRLLFDHQRTLAQRFGYREDARLAVEQFMHDYYLHVLRIRVVNEVLLQHCREALLPGPRRSSTRILNTRFRVRDGYLETVDAQTFVRNPSALLELFVLLARHAEIKGVRAGTIRRIRSHLHLIDRRFRDDPRNAALFMDLLRAPHKLVTQLTRMRRYGVLGAYLPEFGAITGQMQHDLFHIYTVDAHILQLLRNLRRFRYESAREQYPVAYHCVHRIDRIELLYVAGIYHDIAKGRGGDHSQLGAVEARAFCERHGIKGADAELVAWLVEHHLDMSATAQRKDIADPDVIREFAELVGSQRRLDYLYALTAADITATNPSLWNAWRASLLRQLYTSTRRALRSGMGNELSRSAWIENTVELALAKLLEKGISRTQAMRLWGGQEDTYFLQQSHNDIVWQTEAINGHDLADGPLVRLRNTSAGGSSGERAPEGGTMIFLYTSNQPNLFAASVIVLDQLGLSIHDARIYTSVGNVCFNTYVVLDEHGELIEESRHAAYAAEITARLRRVLRDPRAVPNPVARRVPRSLRHFSANAAVHIDNDESSEHSVVRVICPDRPGLLAQIGRVFVERGLTIHGARIVTLGESVEDTFTVTRNESKLTDEAFAMQLRDELCERLDCFVADNS